MKGNGNIRTWREGSKVKEGVEKRRSTRGEKDRIEELRKYRLKSYKSLFL